MRTESNYARLAGKAGEGGILLLWVISHRDNGIGSYCILDIMRGNFQVIQPHSTEAACKVMGDKVFSTADHSTSFSQALLLMTKHNSLYTRGNVLAERFTYATPYMV